MIEEKITFAFLLIYFFNAERSNHSFSSIYFDY